MVILESQIKVIPYYSSGVLYIENALHPKALKIILNEMEKNKTEFNVEDNPWALFKRWYPDPNTDSGNKIKHVVLDLLQNEEFYNAVKDISDLSWKRYNNYTKPLMEVQITKYRSETEDEYIWHVDHSDSQVMRSLNWVCYLNDDFKGGETQFANEQNLEGDRAKRESYHTVHTTLKPKKYSLLIMPSWIPHKVKRTTSGNNRMTLNGHMM